MMVNTVVLEKYQLLYVSMTQSVLKLTVLNTGHVTRGRVHVTNLGWEKHVMYLTVQ